MEVTHKGNENNQKQGSLKIFFGYAAGVGKTYAMLEAAHQAQKQGIDIVVGYIERHTRPDTLALLEGLEQLPNKEIDYKGIKLKEFDLDAALKLLRFMVMTRPCKLRNTPRSAVLQKLF